MANHRGPANRHASPDPTEICYAPLRTATVEVDGFEFITQCGHPLKDH